MLAEEHVAASWVIEAFHGLEQNILIQKDADPGVGRRDIRGSMVVGAQRSWRPCVDRRSRGSSRSGIPPGRDREEVTLAGRKSLAQTAAAPARVARADGGGSGHARSGRGPMVMEVNSSPGAGGDREDDGGERGGDDHRTHRARRGTARAEGRGRRRSVVKRGRARSVSDWRDREWRAGSVSDRRDGESSGR